MNRGEVWWVRDGPRLRPYVVLTRQIAIPALHSVIAAPTTRTNRGIATQVELDPADGMPEACVISLDNLTLVPKDLFVSRICVLSPARLAQVCSALAVAVDC